MKKTILPYFIQESNLKSMLDYHVSYLVRLPCSVAHGEREDVSRDVAALHDVFDAVHGRNLLPGTTLEQLVGEFHRRHLKKKPK